MGYRRCRKAMIIIVVTAVILSVAVQKVDAAPERAANLFYNQLSAWHESLRVEIMDLKDLLEAKLKGNRYLKYISFGGEEAEDFKEETNCQDISFTILNLPEEEETVLKDEEAQPLPSNEEVKPAELRPVSANNSPVKKQLKKENISRGTAHNSRLEDVELLARIIYAEARGESFEGQVAVGAVVLNRVQHPQFPKTIREVVYQPGQFSAVMDGQIKLSPDSKAYKAAQAALAGQDPTKGALFYYNPKISRDQWIRTRNVVCSIGNHNFCI
ncbi:MAG: cell wall hydrolase [Desulfitobacteriia bacterium]